MSTSNRLDLETLGYRSIGCAQNSPRTLALLGKNRRLVADEPVEFEK